MIYLGLGLYIGRNDKMKVRASVKRMCAKCKVIKRKGNIMIICENPKITPYRTKILKKLSKITKTNENRISLKSSTTEKLGFLGREEGISVLVQVSIKILNIYK